MDDFLDRVAEQAADVLPRLVLLSSGRELGLDHAERGLDGRRQR